MFIKVVICSISVLVIGVSIYFITKQTNEYKELKQEKKELEQQVEAAKKAYNKRRNQIQEKFYAEDHTNSPEIVRGLASYNNSYVIMNDLANRFFKTYFTWQTSEDYIARSSKLTSVATNSLLRNQKIFDNGKDSLGGDYVENTGVKSEFTGVNTFMENKDSALVEVNYSSWFNDERNSAAHSKRYYYVRIKSDEQKINNLNLVFSSEK